MSTTTKTQELQKPTKSILAPLQSIEDSLSRATLQQMSRVIIAMLVMTGREMMLGLSRWAGKSSLPDKTDDILVAQIFPNVATLAAFMGLNRRFLQANWRKYCK